jgi:hypothetical protein
MSYLVATITWVPTIVVKLFISPRSPTSQGSLLTTTIHLRHGLVGKRLLVRMALLINSSRRRCFLRSRCSRLVVFVQVWQLGLHLVLEQGDGGGKGGRAGYGCGVCALRCLCGPRCVDERWVFLIVVVDWWFELGTCGRGGGGRAAERDLREAG